MGEVAEEVTTGSMSNFEYLLVSAIVHHSYRDTEDWTDVQSFDIDVITEYFESIRNIAKLLNMQLPMFKRSKSEIEKALKHYIGHSLRFFTNCTLSSLHTYNDYVLSNYDLAIFDCLLIAFCVGGSKELAVLYGSYSTTCSCFNYYML